MPEQLSTRGKHIASSTTTLWPLPTISNGVGGSDSSTTARWAVTTLDESAVWTTPATKLSGLAITGYR